MYTLNASGVTAGNFALKPLWSANVDNATRLFIQNRSGTTMEVVVALPAVDGVTPPPLIIELPGSAQESGNFTDHTVVDPTLAVSVRSVAAGAGFTAVRIT